MRKLSVAILTVSMAASLAACSGGSSGGGTPAGQPTTGAAAKAAITTTYQTFFSAPIPQAMALLEDGTTLTKAFAIANKLKGKMTESAKVNTVTLTGPTTADVNFALSANGTVLIPSSDGKAVYVNGKWLVAKQTFCTLIGLGYAKPIPNC